MFPQPLQRPRPPLMIAANDPAMFDPVAKYADTWITFGGMDMQSLSEMLTAVAAQSRTLDQHCETICRDPTVLKRWVFIRTEGNTRRCVRCPEALRIVSHATEISVSARLLFSTLPPYRWNPSSSVYWTRPCLACERGSNRSAITCGRNERVAHVSNVHHPFTRLLGTN